MSRHAMTWVLDNSTVSGQPQVLLIALADRCHDGSAVCWPGYQDMQRRLKVGSKRSVDLHLDKLREAGEIVSENRYHQESGHRRKVYRLVRYEQSLLEADPKVSFGSAPSSPEGLLSNDPKVYCASPEGLLSNDPKVYCSPLGTQVNGVNGVGTEPPPVELPSGFPDTEAKAIKWAMGAMPDPILLELWKECYAVGGRIPWRKNLPPISNWRSFVAAEASKRRDPSSPGSAFSKNGAPLSANTKPAERADLSLFKPV